MAQKNGGQENEFFNLDFIEHTPGPGCYDITEPYKNTVPCSQRASMGFRTGKRLFYDAEAACKPSSHNYNIRKDINDAVKYSIRPKYNDAYKNLNPGPGAYTPKKQDTQIYNTAGWRPNPVKTDNFPGPGTYENNGQKTEANQFSFAQNNKPFILPKQETPGPNVYQPYRYKNEARAWSLRSRHRVKIDNEVPGPNAYDTAKYTGTNARGLSMRSRCRKLWVGF